MIFYFTATGNSKYVAEKVAEGIGDDMKDIAECIRNGEYVFEISDGKSLGFVIPVYYYGIPMIVAEFLQKLKVSEQDIYSYVILNCGGRTADAERIFRRSYDVDAVFGLETVTNYVISYEMVSKEEISERLDQADADVNKIVDRLGRKERGTFNDLKGHAPSFMTSVAYPVYKRGRKTSKFTVDDDCTGCGLCERICPRNAIRLEDGRPSWVIPQCELCLGCLNRCPAVAINYGRKSAGNGRYVNPRVSI